MLSCDPGEPLRKVGQYQQVSEGEIRLLSLGNMIYVVAAWMLRDRAVIGEVEG